MIDVRTLTGLRTTALSAVVAVLLFMSGLMVLFTPLPLVYAYVTQGRRMGIAACGALLAVTACMYGWLLPWLTAQPAGSAAHFLALPGVGLAQHLAEQGVRAFGMTYSALFVAIAIALGEGVLRELKVVRWAGGAVAAGVACIAFAASAAQFATHGAFVAGIAHYFEAVIADVVSFNQAAGMTSEQIAYLAQNGPEVARVVMSLMPSLMFVFVLIVVVINMLVGRRLTRLPHAVARMRETVGFRLPDAGVWVVIACGVVFFVNLYVVRMGWLKAVALTGLVAMAAIYFFQGFAVVSFFLERVRMKLVKLMAYIAIILFFQAVSVAFVGLGFADVWLHFRERLQKSVAQKPHAS